MKCLRDFDKSLFNTLKKTEFDYLIIDLIDERLNILKLNQTFITRSSEFVSSGLEKKYNFEMLDKNSMEYEQNWKITANKFITKLKEIVPVEKIILYEAYWAKTYIENGETKKFPNIKQSERNNQILKSYYNTIKDLMPAKIIKVDNPIGNAHHIWGLSQFHYTDEYYYEASQKLDEISNENSFKLCLM